MSTGSAAYRLVVLATLVGLVFAEVGLRVAVRFEVPLAWKLREWDPRAAGVELLGPSCLRARPGSIVRFPNGAVAHVNRLGYRGPEVALPKPPGVRRVVVLGGSTTHGCLVDDDETVDAHLRRGLVAAGTSAEVVNLGFDGLDALCDLARLRAEGLAHAPDVVVAHTGVNDVLGLRFAGLAANDPARGFRAERRVAEEARAAAHGPWAVLKHWLYLARVPGVVRAFAAPRGSALPGPPEPSAAARAEFAATLRGIATSVPPTTLVVFSLPPTRPVAGRTPQCGAVVVDDDTTMRYRAAIAATMRDVAAELATAGRRVRFVEHDLAPDAFLDECHPTSAGNAHVAADLVRVVAPALRDAAPGDAEGSPVAAARGLPAADAAGMRDAR